MISMRITAFVGSSRRKSTYNAVEQFMYNVGSLGEIEYEIIFLSDYNLKTCQGCKMCFDKGEEFCPLKDDRDILIDKILNSHGVVFASPNYSFQVSGHMKIFLDRLAFLLHRLRFFGKAFTNIVVQGIYGGDKIVKYLDFVGKGLGFNTAKGCCLTALEPMTIKEQKNIDKILDKQSRQFYRKLISQNYPVPSLFGLMIFRMTRTGIKLLLDESNRDYTYFMENGWFNSDYYYPVKLGLFRKWVSNVFDLMSASKTKSTSKSSYS